MKRLVSILGLMLLSATASAASSNDEAFETLADEYVADLASLSKVGATLIGDHSSDHELDQVDDAARAEVLSLLRDYKAALAKLNFEDLSVANQIDAELLLHSLESAIWEIEELQEWAWNPLRYVQLSGGSIYGLLARDFAPLPERLRSATSRLEQLPRFLEQARDSLDPQRLSNQS